MALPLTVVFLGLSGIRGSDPLAPCTVAGFFECVYYITTKSCGVCVCDDLFSVCVASAHYPCP